MWYVYTVEYYSAIKRENPIICNNMDESEGQCVMWNKSSTERHILYDLKSKIFGCIEVERRILVFYVGSG
jgi:hypothetical protein